MGAFDKTLVTGSEGGSSKVFEQPVKLVNADGSAFAGGAAYTLPAATASVLGGVKMAATTPDVNASAAAAAAGDAPTKAEFDAVVSLANATRATLNALLGRLEAAGIVASK